MSDDFDSLWGQLSAKFAVGDTTTGKASTRAVVLHDGLANDDIARHLHEYSWVLKVERDGRMHISCPFESEHSSKDKGTATTYFPANTGGYSQGHFKCLHAHCDGRTQAEFKAGVEFREVDLFDVLEDDAQATPNTDTTTTPKNRFEVVGLSDFAGGVPPAWIIKGVLPKAELAVMYGESGSGKSFFVFDMLMHIVIGKPWRGRKTKQAACVYVAAEAAAGFRNRAAAYAEHHGLDLPLLGLPLGVIGAAPNLMDAPNVNDLIKAIKTYGEVGVVVIDTLAASMVGDENAGTDMGLVIRHCKAIAKHTGALVVLVHHSGKDASKGARGWGGLRQAADVEICITRLDKARKAKISKQKDGDDSTDNEFAFELAVVDLGCTAGDSDDRITSCVAVPTELNVKTGYGQPPDTVQELVATVVRDFEEMGAPATYDAVVGRAECQIPKPKGRDNRAQRIKEALGKLVEGKNLSLVAGVYERVNEP